MLTKVILGHILYTRFKASPVRHFIIINLSFAIRGVFVLWATSRVDLW